MAIQGLAQAFMNAVQSAFSVTVGSAGQPFYTAAQTLMPSGTVLSFLGTSAPSGFLLCNGQLVSRTTYSNLFGIIGTTYGAGDGSTTFAVPNFQGCFLRGNGTQTINSVAYTSAALGTAQQDSEQPIGGTFTAACFSGGTGEISATGAFTAGSYFNAAFAGGGGGANTAATYTFGASLRTSTETRPVNFSVNFIIAT